MPNPLNNVAVPDQYSDAASILNIFGGRGGTFDVRDQPYFYQLQYGTLGASYWTDEASQQPGSGAIEPGAIGVRFRNQVAGQAGTVDAKIAPPGQPLLTLTSAGTVGSTVLTGIVSGGGVILGGTGYSVVRNGVGLYTVTFTTAFSAAPVVIATVISGANQTFCRCTADPTSGGFQLRISAIDESPRDYDFNFIAQLVQ